MATIALVLSGCGVYDGAEIHESVLTLLALSEAQATVKIYAPDTPQAHVINHLKGAVVEEETRNVLVESARIARGNISALSTIDLSEIDAVVLPGGFGVAKNLCTFAFDGPDCNLNQEVSDLLQAAHAAGKPLGFACIAPALAARVFNEGLLTLGHADDPSVSGLQALGATHQACTADSIVVDEQRRVVSTPAYMIDAPLTAIRTGLKQMVDQVLAWCLPEDQRVQLSDLQGWTLHGGALYQRFTFDNFLQALSFTQKVGQLAEELQHHPDLSLGWGYVEIKLITHDIGGLGKLDFSLATRINQLKVNS